MEPTNPIQNQNDKNALMSMQLHDSKRKPNIDTDQKKEDIYIKP